MKIKLVICDVCGHKMGWGELIHTVCPNGDPDMPAPVVQHLCDKCFKGWMKDRVPIPNMPGASVKTAELLNQSERMRRADT